MSRPLRILHTEAAVGMGGQEIYILRHMQVMRARGHNVSLLCQPDAQLLTAARKAGFTVHTLRMGGLLRMLRGIPFVARLVRRHQYDVVNTTSRRDVLIAAFGARLGGAPLVVRSRHLMSPINSLLTYTTLPHRVLTVSEFVKKMMVERGVPADNIGIVPPMAVPPQWGTTTTTDPWERLQEAKVKVRAKLGFSSQDIVVGCVAVLRRPKGHVDLLKAMVPLCQENSNVHLVIVGDGQPVMSQLLAIRDEHNLQRQVHLLGYRNDAPQLMPGFDIFALATHKDAAGTVFLEAAFAGLPIVATRVGGVPEMVAENDNAILTQLGDNNALTEALSKFINNPDQRQRMGRAGWEWIQKAEQFSPSGHATMTERYYRRWLSERGHIDVD